MRRLGATPVLWAVGWAGVLVACGAACRPQNADPWLMPCDGFATAAECLAQAGCTSVPSCDGIPAACVGLGSAATCSAQSGCSWTAACTGTPRGCNRSNREELCTALAGCDWNPSTGICSGTPLPCATFDPAHCVGQTDCVVAGSCAGDPTPCARWGNDADCERQPGCAWVPGPCTGTPVARADLPPDLQAWQADEHTIPVSANGRQRVDIVVMVDNSNSMAPAQAELTRTFHGLIADLVQPPDEDGDGMPDAPPVEDLRVGVVSSDMGTAGYTVPTCVNSAVGDDGCFLRGAAGSGACPADLPTFLRLDPATAGVDAATLGDQFACLGTLGTSGCGFEQPLESMWRATTGNAAPGGCNAGFLRDDSMLVLLYVSDEDDCSAAPDGGEMFDQSADLGNLDVRCILHPELLRPLEFYGASLLGLRSREPGALLFAAVVGVPLDPACELPGSTADACLALDAMQALVDPADCCQELPACRGTDGHSAWPARRFVQLAGWWRERGGGAYVRSKCLDDWTETMAGLRREIAARLRPECLPEELSVPAASPSPAPNASCAADCSLVEMLPADRWCAEDAACPAAACPPATLDEMLHGTAAPCRDPATGAACTPLARDLGVIELPGAAAPFRGCVVRQAAGSFDPAAGRCVAPDEPTGWRYVAPAWSDPPAACPHLELPWTIREDRDAGGVLRLYCAAAS